MSVVLVIIVFVLFLTLCIYVHEWGHFVAAKRAGVAVEEFGLGFPPRILSIKRGKTVYSVNALPFGAFVKTAGGDDPSVPGSLASKGAWARLGIYAAGPLVNFLLAFILLSIFLLLPVGVIVGDGLMVHSVVENSAAQLAGIQPGDIILKVNDQPVHKWGDIQEIIDASEEGQEIPVLLQRNGMLTTTTVKPEFDPALQRRVIGVLLCWNRVSSVDDESPAFNAGLRAGDTILSVSKQAIYDSDSLSRALYSGQGNETSVVLLRGREAISISLPRNGEESLRGVEIQWVQGVRLEERRLPVWRAFYLSGSYIIHLPALVIETLPLIKESPDMALVGPIGAGQLAVEAVRSFGFANILFMASIISLGIGIFNLIPVPPLDGGGALVAIIEGFRRGRRLSIHAVRLAHGIGTALLVTLMIVVTFSDVLRLISGEGFGL